MSMTLAWFAVQDVSPEAFLDRLGFEDTGEPDDYFEADHSAGELPGGWFVVVTTQIDLAEPARLARGSEGGRLIACVVLEEALSSLAMEWRDGRQVWSVFRDGAAEHGQLQVEGRLPANFNAVHAEIAALQAEMDREGDGVDVIFELPLDLAEDITGFRHDQMGFDDAIPAFTVLERVRRSEG